MGERGNTVKIALLALAPILAALVFWAGLMLVLGTPYPLMVVSGSSMEPTLEDGDLVVVKGIRIEDIKVGDIVAFYEPRTHAKIITHRVIRIVKTQSGKVLLETKGDNNPESDYERWGWLVSEDDLIGKVIYRLPGLGRVVRFMRTPVGVLLIAMFYGLLLYELFKRP